MKTTLIQGSCPCPGNLKNPKEEGRMNISLDYRMVSNLNRTYLHLWQCYKGKTQFVWNNLTSLE